HHSTLPSHSDDDLGGGCHKATYFFNANKQDRPLLKRRGLNTNAGQIQRLHELNPRIESLPPETTSFYVANSLQKAHPIVELLSRVSLQTSLFYVSSRSRMRLRIRGPSGKSSTVTLDDSATIETLKKTIATETSLSSFEVKYGYPPKTLVLDQYAPSRLLSDLEVKLNGEQLIVNNVEPSNRKDTSPQPQTFKFSGAEEGPPAGAAGPSRDGSLPSASLGQTKPPKMRKPSSAPLSLSRKENKEMADPPEIFIPDLGGSLVLRIMPDDNSCLFRAVASAIMSNLDTMTELRSIVAQVIQANPDKYSKAVLDNKDPDSYCRWIQSEDAWGGQIELDILSQQFDVEICSIDVQTLRVDRYNEGAPRRCFLVYSGIHYDIIALSLFEMPPEDDVKQFEQPLSDEVLPQAVALCQKLQERHYFTDTAGFTLRCGDCGTTCVGEASATQHAQATGHYNFGEAS
ncbi:ubiquitin-specific protease otu1, partial [Exophiala xenobiotica]